jgi:uncharacterized membrane protein
MFRRALIQTTILATVLGAGCERGEPPVSFSADVQPILQARCADCHEPGQAGNEASGLRLDTYDDLMSGTRYGPVVVPGDSLNSVLIMLVEGRADPSIKMPHGDARPPTHGEIETLKAWVEQGAANN